ncbi:hypothetical protein ABPG72_012593 [Tetrahymena utriculariae]
MEKDKCDKHNQNQLNLIDYLNKKQGQEQKNNFEDQDSSLENNLSNNSDNEDDSSQKNLREFNFDHSENQNTKIHRNQCMKDNKANKKEKKTDSFNQKHKPNKKSKPTQSNKKTTGMNDLATCDRNAFKNNILKGNEDEEKEETKDSTEQSMAKKNQSCLFDSNEDKIDNQYDEDEQQDQDSKEAERGEDDDYQTIDDDDEAENYDSNNDQNPNQSNPRSNYQIRNEHDNIQNQQDHQRPHERSTLPPLQSLFPDMNSNMTSLSSQLSNLNNSRILLSLPYRTRHHGLGLSLLDQLNNAHQRARSNRARRDIFSQRQRQSHHQYNEIFNDYPSQPLEIQSTESTENQIKQLICERISSIVIYIVLLYFMRNSNMIFTVLATIVLIIIQFYIYLKKKQLEQSRGSQIHENRYFSYRLSDNNNQINENNQDFQNNFDPYERLQRRSLRSRGLENYIRELNQVLLINTFFSIINQFQQQASEAGYNEQQLTQIGGTYKYSELKVQLKQDKDSNMDFNQSNADSLNLDEEEENQCIICLAKYSNDDDVRKLNCKHYFHQHCVDEWLKKKKDCPVCRQCPLNVEASAEDASTNAESNLSNQNNINPPLQIIPSIRTSSLPHQYQMRRNRRPNMDVFLYY